MAGKFELKSTSNGGFMFNLKAGNGQIILTSEIYTTRVAAENAIESVKKNAADASRFEHREAKNGEPCFVLKAGNGQEIGRSEMYTSAAAMEDGILSVQNNTPDASTVEA